MAVDSVPSTVLDAMISVVRVTAGYTDGTSSGTGFIIHSSKDRTLVATNLHVVEGNPQRITVWIGSNKSTPAIIFTYSTQSDLCILELQSPESVQALSPALRFCDSIASQGDAVYAVGFPAAADAFSDTEAHSGDEATITNGIISAIRQTALVEYGDQVKLLQINAAVNPGNSGGPLFNTIGEVIGINTYSVYDSQGIFGAVAIEELTELMAVHGIPVQSAPQPTLNLLLVIIIYGGVFVTTGVVVLIVLKKTKRKFFTISISISVLLCASVCVYFAYYVKAITLAEDGEFSRAQRHLLMKQIISIHDANIEKYINAGVLLRIGSTQVHKMPLLVLAGLTIETPTKWQKNHCISSLDN